MRAGSRSQAEREMPITAATMPMRIPSTVEAAARISVFFSPTASSAGSTDAIASQSKKLR